MDAEAYMIEMLELGERYFEPDDSEPEVELDEDEAYQRLEDEQPLQGWRIA
jgi:hypothetical protein